ncbi:hypothetical protein HMPREF3100_19685 [Enterococcus sp. HMSC29A04]|uniref:hypothetical protein n=1 Tax=Enterococcus TaxID=1350 RepID=UPI0008A3E938|nr:MULTISPECIES: hypothetical protein [Enterococcus]MDT2571187.1 hypothetical protein [Enterococcus raffinosus]OFT82807.1 hypothetical protein HMPREF3100_19685 [Enterococcus sp. HMSC29A04]OFU62778.1 hypothetical protein HMPREF3128_12235 [Enterococcus sp. HMSC14A10]QXJ61366.1 hypothetical protein J9537_15330 [Enterococcus raffinosus]
MFRILFLQGGESIDKKTKRKIIIGILTAALLLTGGMLAMIAIHEKIAPAGMMEKTTQLQTPSVSQ